MITEKRISICLTKEDLKMLEYIKKYLGDTNSGAMRRCLISYFQMLVEGALNDIKKDKKG